MAGEVWARFGDVGNFVDAFFGSGAALFGRPRPFRGTETVNDADGYLANFWRAVTKNPAAMAHYANWPVNENDLHARHRWLVAQKADFVQKLEADPDFYDPKIAGYWVWGLCAWIGGHWCEEREKLPRRRIQVGKGGRGVRRRMPHLGDAGRGVHRQVPHLGNAGMGVHSDRGKDLEAYFEALSRRLRRVRVCSGDWSRVCGPSVTCKQGLTAVFLDPPYGEDRDQVYTHDSTTVAQECAKWCRENENNPLLRVALCGYEGDYELPGWTQHRWKTPGGYAKLGNGRGKENAKRECVWFSPHCLKDRQGDLFDVK